MISNQNPAKIQPSKYFCEKCDYYTCKKSNYNEHLLTAKHQKSTFSNFFNQKKQFSSPNDFRCACGKIYKDKSGLWRHKKQCFPAVDISTKIDNEIDDKDKLIMMLIKQNTDLIKEQTDIKHMVMEQQNIILEIAKNGTNNTTHTNSHNKAFNLNFFLNETCKNAMNITDFVDSIKLQLSDLMTFGELGYVEGISNIIVKNLNDLDETIRPIHCTDKKRETFYIKDQGQWEKDEERKKVKQIIKKIAFKNERLLPQFKEKYPDYNNSDSKFSDQYSKLVIEALGGIGNDELIKEDKIIKNITKATIIDKGL